MITIINKLWPIYLAYLFSQFGNWAFRAGLVYAIYDQQNGSNTILGWTIVLVYVPILLGGKFLSPLVDRFESKNILISIDLFRAILLIPLLFITGFDNNLTVTIGLVIASLLSLFTPVFSSAQSVYIRNTIDEENLTSSLAIISNLDWFSTIVGTICGPLLLMYFNFQKIVLVDLLTFIVSSTIFICLLKKKSPNVVLNKREVQEDIVTVKNPQSFRFLILAIFFLNLGAGVINVYPNVMARNIYEVGELGLSYIYLANGVGGFIGAFLITKLRKKFDLINIVVFSSVFIGISLLLMSVFNNFIISIVSSSLMLLFGQLFGVGIHSYLLKNNPANQAGKITGLFMYATFSGVSLNAILFAIFLSQAQTKVIVIFLILCAVSAFIATFFITIQRKQQMKEYDNKILQGREVLK